MAGRIKKTTLIVTFIVLISTSFYFLILMKNRAFVAILYTTDIQGFITPHKYVAVDIKGNPNIGGAAHLATYVKKERRSAERRNRFFLLVDTGNFFSGQAEGYFLKGLPMIEIMNSIGYDAMVVGPKDFAFGEDIVTSLARKAIFPFLSANIIKEDTGETPDYLRPYIIRESKGVKIGIIGVTNPLIFLKNIRGLKVIDPISAAKKYISILNKEGVNFVIVLSNLGLEGDKMLAQEVQGIGVIIGGNDREGYRNYSFIELYHKTIIPWSWEKAAALMPLYLTFDKRKNKVIKHNNKWAYLYISKYKPDPGVKNIVQRYLESFSQRKKEVIGYALTKFTRIKDEEANLGDWVADILRKKTGTQICLVGGLEADLEKGEITLGDAYDILPVIDRLDIVDFNLAILELTGEQIKDILETGVSLGLERDTGILQVSGLQYTYDAKRRKWDKIVEMTLDGQRLELNKNYLVAVNGYLSAGLGGYDVVKEAKTRRNTGLMDFDAVAEYIEANSPLTAPPLEGRIINLTDKK